MALAYRYHEQRCRHGFLVGSGLCRECPGKKTAAARVEVAEQAKRVAHEVNRILEFVKKRPGSSAAEIADASGVRPGLVHERLTVLQRRGDVVGRKGPGDRLIHYYPSEAAS